jgi:hypothetical protein
MTDFKGLDPETRCYALVGQFLQVWSAMELALHNAIGAALSIEVVKLKILCANMRFGDKTNILRTLVDVSSFSKDEKDRDKRKLKALSRHSSKRNMIAHSPFHPDPSKTGVEFLTVKAKGDFKTPNIVWSPKQFAHEISLISGYGKFLNEIEKRFNKKPLTDYASALVPFVQTDWPVPRRRTMSSDLMNVLSQTPLAARVEQKTEPGEPKKK